MMDKRLVLLTVLSFGQTPAFADPANEVFGAMPSKTTPRPAAVVPVRPKQAPMPQPANPVTAAGAMSMMSTDTPFVRFFEAVDGIAFRGFPTAQERFILQEQFNQELEKVEKWTATAKTVSKRYRDTAKNLRALIVPDNRNDLSDYRNMRASWFESAASVYETLFRPKPPAQTMEELEGQLRKVEQDADSVDKQKQTLLSMDRDLRKIYRVHAPRETDALSNYVMGQPQK